MATTKDELKLVPLNDLIEEIFSRYDDCCVVGSRNNDNQGGFSWIKRQQGNQFVCQGLLHHLMNDIDISLRANMTPDNK